MKAMQNISAREYLEMAAGWLNAHAKMDSDGGFKCLTCGTDIPMMAVKMAMHVVDSRIEHADLTGLFYTPLPRCPTCDPRPSSTGIEMLYEEPALSMKPGNA